MVPIPRASRGPWPDLPIVGRDPEIRAFKDALERAIQANGSLVLVSGEAGIGKTSLVQALMTEACERDALVLSGGAYDLSATPPYGPWLDLIRTYPEDDHLPALPAFMTDRDAVAALGSQEELQRAVLAFFQQVGQVRPLLLVLEDLHWSDHPSLELLRVLARGIGNDPVMLVATFRDDEVTRQHPLYHLLPALVRESGAERIDLRALDEEALRDLIQSRYELDESDEEALVGYLLSRAEGNPLFTVELLRTIELDGTLRQYEGSWKFRNLPDPTVPSLVQQMVERRLTDVSADTRRALEFAALIGQEVTLERWEQVTEFPVGTAAEEALEAHLVEETPDGNGVAFRHALIREAIYGMVPLPSRRLLHQQVAGVYLTDSRPDPEIVAWHLKQAGDPRTAEWLILAGEQAERRFAWQVALERHEDAASLLRERGDNDQLLARLLLRMGRLFRFSDQKRTVEFLEESRALALRIGDEVTAAFALFNIGAYERVPGSKQPRIDKMLSAIETLSNTQQDIAAIGKWAVTRVSDELDPLATIRGTCALQLAWSGKPRDAISLATRHLPEDWNAEPVRIPEFSEQYPNSSYIDAYAGLATAFSHMGLPQKAEVASGLQRRLARQLNFRPGLALQYNCILLLEHFPYRTKNLNERAEIRSFLEDGASWVGESLSPGNRTFGLDYCYLMDGRWALLRNRIQAGLVPSISVLWHMSTFARARFSIYEGNLDRARMLLHQVLPTGMDENPDAHLHPLPGEAQRLSALLALEEADFERAREWLLTHESWMEWIGAVLGRAEGLLLWAKLRRAEGNSDAARAVAEQSLDYARNPEQPIALIAAHRFLGQLATQAQEFDAAKQYLHKSLDLAERCALPYERALSIQAFAELELSRGDAGRARRLLADVRRIATDLGARPLLQRAEALANRLSTPQGNTRFCLLPRETEFLHLLVRGMSDKDIAEELFVSHRTVSHHVSNILRKLDVDSRTAAATRAAQQDIV